MWEEKKKVPPKTILLVDDEKDMDWVISKILTDAGYRVVTAKTGAEGLARFKEAARTIPLVLLDLRLPDMSGLELLRKIKAISSRTKVLMITAFGTPEARKQAKKDGALDVLDKPFRVEKVLKAARLAFEGWGGMRPSLRRKKGKQNDSYNTRESFKPERGVSKNGCRENDCRGIPG